MAFETGVLKMQRQHLKLWHRPSRRPSLPRTTQSCVQRSSLENTESLDLYHKNTAMRSLLTVTTNTSRDARSVTNSKVLKPWLRSRNGPVLAASRANLTRILSRAINKVGLLDLAFRLMELSMNQVGSEHVCAPARFWIRRYKSMLLVGLWPTCHVSVSASAHIHNAFFGHEGKRLCFSLVSCF